MWCWNKVTSCQTRALFFIQSLSLQILVMERSGNCRKKRYEGQKGPRLSAFEDPGFLLSHVPFQQITLFCS